MRRKVVSEHYAAERVWEWCNVVETYLPIVQANGIGIGCLYDLLIIASADDK